MTDKDWIKKYFIVPITEECPENVDPKEFIDDAFGIGYRHLSVYVATKDFTMPGNFLEAGVHIVMGMAKGRAVKKKNIFVARVIDGIKNVEVEFAGRSFRLSCAEWDKVKTYSKPTKGNIELCPRTTSRS